MNNTTPTRHERRRMETRRRLIQAAVELLLERGYDALSIQAITDQADLGRGTFYIHFKDREDVIWAALRDLMLELELKSHDQFSMDKPGPAAAEYYGLLNVFNHGLANRDLYRLALGGKGSAALNGRMQDLFVEIILRDIRRARAVPGAPNTIPEDVLAQILTGAISRLLFWWLDTPNEYSAGQIAEMTYRVIYHKAPFNKNA